MLTLTERIARRVLHATGLRSRHVVTSAGRIHVLEGKGGGDLPPIVVLHGFAAHAVCYGHLLKRFQPRVRRVVAPDLPGHGYSEAPRRGSTATAMLDAVSETLDRVLDEPAILLGNSMGGLAAIRYAQRRPEKVCGLALVSPAGAPLPADEFDAFLARFKLTSYAEALEFVDDVFAKVPALLRHPVAFELRKRFGHPDLKRLIGEISPAHMLTPEDVKGLQTPVLFVWGREERILPRAQYRFWAQNLPEHAFIEEFSDFGHIGFMEQPEALTRRVLDFAQHIAVKGAAQRRSTPEQGHATLRASA